MSHKAEIHDLLQTPLLQLRVELCLLEGRREFFDNDGLAVDRRHDVGDLADRRSDIVRRAGACVVHDVDHGAPCLAEPLKQCGCYFLCRVDQRADQRSSQSVTPKLPSEKNW